MLLREAMAKTLSAGKLALVQNGQHFLTHIPRSSNNSDFITHDQKTPSFISPLLLNSSPRGRRSRGKRKDYAATMVVRLVILVMIVFEKNIKNNP